MNNKVTLVFENNEYTVKFNETILNKSTDCEGAIEIFKNEIKNNSTLNSSDWEKSEAKVRELAIEGLDINSEYKAMSLGEMKYFHHTGKVFYMGSGKMVQLVGGFEFFYTVLKLVKAGQLSNSNTFVGLCAEIIEQSATYSLNEEALSVASAAFSYGMVSYQFAHGKMNKGTASEKCSFEMFAEFVKATI